MGIFDSLRNLSGIGNLANFNSDKPDTEYARSLANQIIQMDEAIKSIVNDGDIQRAFVRDTVADAKNRWIYEQLSAIPIEEINRHKEGIRVSALKNIGINDMFAASKLTLSQLMDVKGIGDETAHKIIENIKRTKNSCERKFKYKINPESMDPNVAKMIQAIYKMNQLEKIYKKAGQVYLDSHQMIANDVRNVGLIGNAISWMMLDRRTKDAIIRSVSRMQYMLNGAYMEDARNVIKEFVAKNNECSIEKAQNEFIQNTAPFYATLEKTAGLSYGEKNELGFTFALDDQEDLKPAVQLELEEQVRNLVEEIRKYELDTSRLNVVLRQYQAFGVKYILNQKRTLLGDEMGLGKTIQAIAAMADLAAKGKTHFLVVCPLSVLVNWYREVLKHSTLSCIEIYSDNREGEFKQWCDEGGVGVTTYETLQKVSLDPSFRFDMLVVDEAHYVKNPNAVRSMVLKNFCEVAEYVLFMTGTPLENKPEEMLNLLDNLNEYVTDEIKVNPKISDEEYRLRIAPVYLRRIREDVLTELPDKEEIEDWCIMNMAEEIKYKESLVSDSFMEIRRLSWNVPDIRDSSKANRLLEICENAQDENRKVLIFSYFKKTIEDVKNLLGDKCFGPIDGSVPVEKRQEMVDEFSKAPAGSALICQIVAGGVGLNIQAASVVVLCEPQWKPSTENQAIARAYRMGQSQKVMVHRLLMDDTVDEEIMNILKAKTEIFNKFAENSEVELAEKNISSDTEISGQDEKKYMKQIVQNELERFGLTRNADE